MLTGLVKQFQVLSAIVIGGVVDATLMETGDTETDVPKSGEALAHPPPWPISVETTVISASNGLLRFSVPHRSRQIPPM
jgi:hypothetical protein